MGADKRQKFLEMIQTRALKKGQDIKALYEELTSKLDSIKPMSAIEVGNKWRVSVLTPFKAEGKLAEQRTLAACWVYIQERTVEDILEDVKLKVDYALGVYLWEIEMDMYPPVRR